MPLLSELQRRNVFRVAMLYLIAGWVLLQVAELLFGALGVPDWGLKFILGLLVLGFPLALIFSWVYELTPEGLKREHDVERNASITRKTGRKINLLIAGLLMVAVALGAYDVFARRAERATAQPVAATPSAPATAAPTSIAVLPFVNMSNDPANEYFSDGMSEEILNTLARVEGLQVAARTSSFRFKGQAADVAEIGRQLKVGAILEGSVRKEGNSVRITAQLINVQNGFHLWSRTFDRTLENVFALQTEIASQIVEALQLQLPDRGAGNGRVELRQLPTENALAYELFLQGRHLWRQRNAPALMRAIQLLTQAVELDPQFAEAHAALASANFVMQNYASVDVAATFARARAAAERARELDSSLAEPVAVLAMMRMEDRQWGAAERELRRAIDLDPDQATPHHWLALEYQTTGHLRRFSAEIQRAYALDPTNAGILALVGVSHQLAGDMQGAIHSYELAASMGGVFAMVTRLPEAYYEAGQPARAVAASRRGYATIGLDPRLAELIHAAVLDPTRTEQAREAILAAPRASFSAHQRIAALIRIGQFEVAVNEALTAPDAMPTDLLYIAWYRSYAPFRRTPAFRRFVRESGLLDYWREDGWPDLCRPAGDDFVCD